jgi:hypothetical protein
MVRVFDWEMPLTALPAPHDYSRYVREWFLSINASTAWSLALVLTRVLGKRK